MLSFFEKRINPFPPEHPEQPPQGLYAFCRHYTRGLEGSLLAMSCLTAMLAILEVTLFSFMGDLVDWLSTQSPDTLFASEGTKLLLMSLVVLVAMPVVVLLHALITYQSLLGNYPMRIRWQAHRYLLKQSLNFYENDFAGRLATKVMQTALGVRETVMKLLDVLVYILVYFISALVMIGTADWRLMLPMVVWLAAYIGIQFYFVPRMKKIATEQADARSVMTGRVVDSYTNIQTVKLFSHTERETSYARDSMDGFLGTVYHQMRLATGLNFSVNMINYLLAFTVAALSIWLWMDSAITVGAIAIAVSLALRVNGMAQWIMWEISSLFENLGTVADGMNTLAKPQTITDPVNAPKLNAEHGEIALDDVHFSYEGADDKSYPVFEALNLTIKPGEKIGLVGRSGAGKSTLVNLLLRFYDIDSGQIKIDGQDISQVSQESLRSKIGMVTQDTSLLHRSVRDNILYGRPDASDAEVLDAARKAEADAFIRDLHDPEGNTGYDAQVGERGVKLSGGQRQRIAIARVLLKDAPILILDEATSALDSEVEAAIQQSLYRLMENKTVIAIAHRLSTIAAMDRLIVLDDGKIAEQGTHEELLAQGGIYAQLWAHQTGGFLGEG
ncbi:MULTISPECIES: ABC transporter ATP-binding protein [Thalassolituus]|uniref:ABC transporter ATP-binding protein n=2 Tax=Oceanospirillaceae TaxID=135620 RepID=UPI0007CF18B6|nr:MULTISPECIES: ABC transporter ATP-binding protein [Thalassolituus]KZY97244.1 multidrug ABC transporter ATP-binding protein [Oleibacter sp. HI0075]MAX85376.1 ABC transporter ATP-binding protein [Oceanospirillaceae bacterium]|tara:strand:+ start:177 stop:2018 length:1842 start_codon:yes stop_codon:yes gene_type:complete